MMYDERFIAPMRAELTAIGFEELRTPEDVDAKLPNTKGTTLVVVNSMCGCAARNARPGVAQALQQTAAKPDHLTTVFAGQDAEATERARSYFTGYPPSSPSIALMRDGQLIYMMERYEIEGRPATAIAADLAAAFERFCGAVTKA
ncbi:MAG TPA: BrxA/BrxB family bacilliredoxin [Gemmatimonadaceae bacterium]|nr:BrxA/BrxB family bacilliredoxin [Gemmatimonadaceae bacterium]